MATATKEFGTQKALNSDACLFFFLFHGKVIPTTANLERNMCQDSTDATDSNDYSHDAERVTKVSQSQEASIMLVG